MYCARVRIRCSTKNELMFVASVTYIHEAMNISDKAHEHRFIKIRYRQPFEAAK